MLKARRDRGIGIVVNGLSGRTAFLLLLTLLNLGCLGNRCIALLSAVPSHGTRLVISIEWEEQDEREPLDGYN
jgi:hypothetical protein